jgi:hypothetical protein
LEEEHAPDEKELAGMPKEDLEEKMVLEESITSIRREKEAEHRMVEDSFETLHDDWLCAWMRAKKKGKKTVRASGVPHFPTDELEELWMATLTRRVAVREAEAFGSNRHFADIAKTSGSRDGVAIEDAEASNSGNGINVLDVSSSDKEDV